ncbi:DUF1707 SHOCT-like domain-containing protein [Nocardia australiensis]|uniref:DUF1707 SHOCT-like domain-containing protein n=1 Tax=Nocardia australiensis TaxID=2887191 RepID=UPI001D13EA3A|nr:DUF1707 domain-containing protein [Nocardia australiensis]
MAATRYSGIRARDTDRADVCGLLDAALADGQLTGDEHASRTAAAMRAKTFGELDAVFGDLQIPDDLVDAPVVRVDRRQPRRWLAPLAVVVAAAVTGAAVGGITRGITNAAAPSASKASSGHAKSSENVPVLTTGAGMAYFIAEYRAQFGDTTVDAVTLYPDSVTFSRAVTGDPTATARYHYDGDFDDPTISTGREQTVRSFDLTALNLPALAGLLAGAPQSTKVSDGAISLVEIEFESDSAADAGPTVEISTKNQAGASGILVTTSTGEPLRVSVPS